MHRPVLALVRSMRYLELDGVPALSKIGLGTWQFGSREWGYGEAYASREAGRIVRRALELGVTLIDTAEIYGFGRSERIVGAALGADRDHAFLATKIFPLLPIAPVVRRRAAGSARRLADRDRGPAEGERQLGREELPGHPPHTVGAEELRARRLTQLRV